MRPGPGLVVMALAFLSTGPRRGGTTTTTTTTTTATATNAISSSSSRGGSGSSSSSRSSSGSSSSSGGSSRGSSSSGSSSSQFPGSASSPFDWFYLADQTEPAERTQRAAASPSRAERRIAENILARVNPWLSACDLAQPDIAPDLQGECSAGSLPVPTVSEGPGPPVCPESCDTMRRREKSTSTSSRNNNNYNSNTPSQHTKLHTMSGGSKSSSSSSFSTSSVVEALLGALRLDGSLRRLETPDDETMRQLQEGEDEQQQQPHQQQQCLDYFGDTEANSPAQVCATAAITTKTTTTSTSSSSHKTTPTDIISRLRHLRLRHCCERTVLSALHNDALAQVRRGGADCVRTLSDLLQADALADRITCEMNDILLRYDCRQTYSIKHGCLDCKEAYRRWGCSSLIPFFAEPDDIRPRRTVNDADSASTSTVRSGTTVVSSAATTNQPAAAASAVQQRQQRDVEGSSHVHKQHYSKTSWLSASMSSSSSSSSTSSRTIIASGDARQTVVVNGAASPEVTRGRSGISNVMPWTSSSSKSASLESIRNGNHRAKRHNNNDRNNTFSMTTTTSTTGDSQGDYNSKTSNSSTNDSATSTQTFRHEEDPIAARSLRRSRRKSDVVRRKIRPCLSVCQTVEENCPYMLPNDRAPAMPTQYAGEPTFLCLDPNIPETGDQLAKSNHGPDNCCYRYCSASPLDGVCAVCNPKEPSDADTSSSSSSPSSTSPVLSPFSSTMAVPDHSTGRLRGVHDDATDDFQLYAEHCPVVPAAIAGPSRCMTPFQVSVAAAAAAAAKSSAVQSALPRRSVTGSWRTRAGSCSSSSSNLLAILCSVWQQSISAVMQSPMQYRPANGSLTIRHASRPTAAAAISSLWLTAMTLCAWATVAFCISVLERVLLLFVPSLCDAPTSISRSDSSIGSAGEVGFGAAVSSSLRMICGSGSNCSRCVAALAIGLLCGQITS